MSKDTETLKHDAEVAQFRFALIAPVILCGYSVCSLRQVPVRHNRGGKSTENKVRFAPPTMCRLTAN